MRKVLTAAWLLLPLGAWAFHEGPGQTLLEFDAVDTALADARAAAADEDWSAAAEAYEEALSHLATGVGDSKLPGMVRSERQIRLALNQARMQGQQLVKARDELRKLVEEMAADQDADPELLAKAQSARAHAQYYYTWLMRLEGYPRSEWEPEIEVARQTWRLLAEQAAEGTDGQLAMRQSQDLESAVKLARIDLEELQGIPLPNQ